MTNSEVSLGAEYSEYVDSATGNVVIRWTNHPEGSQHLYFTSPTITRDGRYMVVISGRGGAPNLYRIDRQKKTLQKLTNSSGLLRSYTYPTGGASGLSKASPFLDDRRSVLYYIQDDQLWRLPLEVPQQARKLVDLPKGWVTGYVHVSDDGSSICVPVADPRAFCSTDLTQHDQLRSVPLRMLKQKLSTFVMVFSTEDGEKIQQYSLPFWSTHVQFLPGVNDKILCNSEGPKAITGNRSFEHWGRMWCLSPCLKPVRFGEHPPSRIVNHETVDYLNRLVVCHGVEGVGALKRMVLRFAYLSARFIPQMRSIIEKFQVHYIRFFDLDGVECFHVNLPFPVSHAIPDQSAAHLYADSRDGFIYKIERITKLHSRLVFHGSRMGSQDSHPHPVRTSSQAGVLFSSDKDGVCNVYEAKLG